MFQILNRPTLKHVMFLQKYKEKQFVFGYMILTEGVMQSSYFEKLCGL
jgi:hypothetical protein